MDGNATPLIARPGGPPPSLRPVEFVSRGKDFIALLIKGGVLEIVTFGFYRFWLATSIRRHLWSHTVVDGENAEYTGTGRELLIGFLFALAILVPIYLVYFLIGIEAERYQAFASVPLALFMVLFGSFATYRARRYRLTRTIWRGVRFWMQGSGWKYAFMAFGWSILVVLSLGAAYPWRTAALERYKMQHTFYGDLQGRFTARPGAVFRRGFGMWLYFLLTILMLIGGGVAAFQLGRAASSVIVGFGIFMLMTLSFIYPFFRALEWRWWADGVQFGQTCLRCDLRGGALLGLFFKYLVIASVATSAAAALIIAVGAVIGEALGLSLASLKIKDLNDFLTGNTWMVAAGMVAGYLAIIMVAGVVQRFFLQHEYWRIITGTLTLIHPEAMRNVTAKGDLAHALGEGLADGFDVAGF